MTGSRGLRFTASVIQWGPIPPSGGPLREQYLDVNGREALRIADADYKDALRALGECSVEMPTMHMPLAIDDDTFRREVQLQKRSEWREFLATSDQETLEAVEPLIRGSEAAAVAALNFLEDHELAEFAHLAIHRSAFVRRGLYGCPIVLRDDDEFWTKCSIKLSHLRLGTSAGLTSDFECSICGEMLEDCDHDMNEVYDKTAFRDEEGHCAICQAADCEHEIGKDYPTRATGVARNLKAEEVSIVARPRYPQSRITEKSIDLGGLGDDLSVRRAAKNNELDCDACLGPCSGFIDMKSLKASVGEIGDSEI